ncbi:MAG TPA: TetR/AcrR family transcriptional regulator [Solirubrobacterales bacterium]
MDSSSASNPRAPHSSAQTLPPAYAVRGERERLLEAMVRNAAAKGYEGTAVEDVTATAQLPRETFDSFFGSKQDCFLEAYDAVIDVVFAHVAAAYESAVGEPWPDRVVRALRALVDLLASEADIARMAIVEMPGVGEDARLRYRAALGRFAPFLDEGREFAPRAAELPPDTASFAIGGLTSKLFDEVRAGRTDELRQLVPDLTFAVLVPYLGPEEAEAEMRRVAARG